jgi:hypothetical protein
MTPASPPSTLTRYQATSLPYYVEGSGYAPLYFAEEVDRLLAVKDAEIAQLQQSFDWLKSAVLAIQRDFADHFIDPHGETPIDELRNQIAEFVRQFYIEREDSDRTINSYRIRLDAVTASGIIR